MEFIQLRAYDSYIEANLRMQQLEAEGIRAVLRDEYTVTIDPLLTNAVGGIKLMVPQAQWARARSVIERLEAQYRASFVCPQCSHPSVQKIFDARKSVNGLVAWLTGLIGGNAVADKEQYRCFACGWESDRMPEHAPPETE